MVQKLKFKPVVTRVKLNPEQAVLFCNCYMSGVLKSTGGTRTSICVTRVGANKCAMTGGVRSTANKTNTS